MSRPTKFRAWDNAKKEWTLNIMECVSSRTGNIWMEPALKSHKVVIEQYTGLKDKNGKEIYEGDIVKCWGEDCCEVYFDTISLQYRVKFSDGDDEDLVSSKPEIIGNIHENPELLEGEK